MRSDRRYPAWLVRRSYFKRVGRWLKPKPRDEADAAPSNVVRFPAAPDRSPWAPDLPRRGVGSA